MCRIASFKTRKDIANGIFISKLSYLIVLWCSCTSTLLRSLHILQNKAARTVTNLDWSTNTSVLLNQCGWLSVHQLVVYHSVLQVYKVMQTKKPKSLHSMFKTEYSRNTRESLSGQIKQEGHPNLDITSSSFRWRASKAYNQIPACIRNTDNLQNFKRQVKSWIKTTIPLHLNEN